MTASHLGSPIINRFGSVSSVRGVGVVTSCHGIPDAIPLLLLVVFPLLVLLLCFSSSSPFVSHLLLCLDIELPQMQFTRVKRWCKIQQLVSARAVGWTVSPATFLHFDLQRNVNLHEVHRGLHVLFFHFLWSTADSLCDNLTFSILSFFAFTSPPRTQRARMIDARWVAVAVELGDALDVFRCSAPKKIRTPNVPVHTSATEPRGRKRCFTERRGCVDRERPHHAIVLVPGCGTSPLARRSVNLDEVGRCDDNTRDGTTSHDTTSNTCHMTTVRIKITEVIRENPRVIVIGKCYKKKLRQNGRMMNTR